MQLSTTYLRVVHARNPVGLLCFNLYSSMDYDSQVRLGPPIQEILMPIFGRDLLHTSL